MLDNALRVDRAGEIAASWDKSLSLAAIHGLGR
jgi:hypothetical protein